MAGMFPDIFETNRLLLRPIEMSDAESLFHGYAQDPEVSRYLSWRPHKTIVDTEAFVRSCQEKTAAKTYVLIRRSDQTIIGSFDLRRTGEAKMGFGYVSARAVWGRGLMTEALTEIVDWALRQPGIWRIGDVADVDNYASQRVMEKAGLEREGLLRRWGMHPNVGATPRDCVSYAKVA